MSDIARRARVSKNTVSLALRNNPQIPPATRQRIRKIADRIGYRKNPVVAHLMAQLRVDRSPRFQSTLGLLNANLDARAFTQHPTVPVYIEGCRQRAAELGYQLDEFWLHDPGLDGARLNRNIRGVIVVGLMDERRLPERFASTWDLFPSVVTGVSTRAPSLSFASVDHHLLALRAVESALALGYRRPGLALDARIDDLVDGRFSSGFLIAQRQVPASRRVQPFYFDPDAVESPAHFKTWLQREKPDVILTLYNIVRQWIEHAGLKVPRDIALIQMERRRWRTDWAGMDQHSDVIGAAAVDMVIAMIHNHQPGLPLFPRATLIGSTWRDGSSCPPRMS
jgi:LacI family transcriptional regulator